MSQSASASRFESIFSSALDAYTKRTSQDLASHPLLPRLQSCDTPGAIITLLREQIPAFSQSQSSGDRFSSCLIPIVNVLYVFSATLGEGVGLVFSPAKVLFAGISVLFLAAKDVSTSQEKLIELFNRIGYFFRRLEIYTSVPPTPAMTDVIVEIMVRVIMILGIATREMQGGRLKKYLKKLVGNTEIEDALQDLDKLTQEEVRIASAELLKVTHSTDGKVMGVDDRVRGVDARVQVVGGDVQDVRRKVRGVNNRVQGIGSSLRHMINKVQGVDDKLDQVNRHQLRECLLRWLSPPDPSTTHNIACNAHHNGTAQWFLQGSIFNQWKFGGSFLWLYGTPGSGKSVLCSSIIQDIMALRDAGGASMAYFYFDFRDADKQKLHNLLRSLLIQLSARSDPSCDMLFRLYSDHNRGVEKPSDRAMIECLKEMLTLEGQRPTYIIMDAVDECPITSSAPSPREAVLELVKDLVGLQLPNLCICVTSRPELDIQAVLEPLVSCSVSLHEESGQRADIIEYVRSFVHSDRRMQRWRDEDKDLVIETLSEKADGMFRYVFCQLEVLRYCFPPSVPRTLEELPDSLDETYERILRDIRRPNQEYACRLLQCLVAAARPLRVEELAEVLAFDFSSEGIPKKNPGWRWEDQEEAVTSACSSLVIVVKDGDSRIVQFSHFSVQEFLTSDRLARASREEVSRYHVPLEAAHTILAQACIGVLLQLDPNVDRDTIKSFPLIEYASDYWAWHAEFKNVLSRVEDGIECLLDGDKPHFATCFSVFEALHASTRPPDYPKFTPTPIYHASRNGFYSLVEHLIASHPDDVNAMGGPNGTPLHAATIGGHVEIVLLLLKHVPVDIRSTALYRTPLLNAAVDGHMEVGRHLLDHGADVNARDNHGWTPLHLAASFGHVEFMRLLLDHGANPHARDDQGKTPSEDVPNQRQQEILGLLSEYGFEPEEE